MMKSRSFYFCRTNRRIVRIHSKGKTYHKVITISNASGTPILVKKHLSLILLSFIMNVVDGENDHAKYLYRSYIKSKLLNCLFIKYFLKKMTILFFVTKLLWLLWLHVPVEVIKFKFWLISNRSVYNEKS